MEDRGRVDGDIEDDGLMSWFTVIHACAGGYRVI